MRRRLLLPFALIAGAAASATVAGIRGEPATRAAPDRAAPPGLETPAPASPAVTPSATEPRGELRIHAVGDVNLDPGYVSGLARFGFAHAWAGVGALFREDDLTLVNLECPVAGGGVRQPKTYTFRGDPAGLPAMRAAGVEVASMANNHSQDLGAVAMLETRRNLLASGIAAVGAGADAAEAARPAVLRVRGWTVAVLGFTDILPSRSWIAGSARPGVAAAAERTAMLAAIRDAKRGADLVLVSVHWGVERSAVPTTRQSTLARAMIDAGADAVFGHHPHVLQPLETYRGKPIFYSLGNFVWRRSWPESYTTGVAQVNVATDGTLRARIIPAYLESSGHPVLKPGP